MIWYQHMLTIREAQMDVFRNKQLEEFTSGRLTAVADRFPQRSAALGESATVAFIKSAMKKSFDLGIVGEADVETMVDLMMLHGEDFDSREEFSFETAPLRDKDLPVDARVPLMLARFGLKPGFREE